MAYDPEARKQSNSALIMGLIALLVVGGAALAYFATRQAPEPEPVASTVVHEKETTIVPGTPAPAPDTVVVTPPVISNDTKPDTVIVTPPTTSTTTTTTTRNDSTAPREPVAKPPADSKPGNTTINNTTIVAPDSKSNASPKPQSTAKATTEATPQETPIADDAATNAVPGY